MINWFIYCSLSVNHPEVDIFCVLLFQPKFVQDMAAHSACDFGGGKAEKLALAKYRQVLWQGRVLNSQFSDEELRSQGRCPLTPEEIGLLLAALGFSNNTRLYLASHKVSFVPYLSSSRKFWIIFCHQQAGNSCDLSYMPGETYIYI